MSSKTANVEFIGFKRRVIFPDDDIQTWSDVKTNQDPEHSNAIGIFVGDLIYYANTASYYTIKERNKSRSDYIVDINKSAAFSWGILTAVFLPWWNRGPRMPPAVPSTLISNPIVATYSFARLVSANSGIIDGKYLRNIVIAKVITTSGVE